MNKVIDIDGESFELVPLRKVEKQRIYLLQFGYADHWPVSEDIEMTDSQAEKVAAFLEAGMEYITKDQIIFQTDYKLFETLKQAAIEAREALEGTK